MYANLYTNFNLIAYIQTDFTPVWRGIMKRYYRGNRDLRTSSRATINETESRAEAVNAASAIETATRTRTKSFVKFRSGV